MSHPTDPSWLSSLVPERLDRRTRQETLGLTVAIAEGSVQAGGGPFGALLVASDGTVTAAGWNRVVATHDSTAHAEVVAVRAAQARHRTHDLSQARGAPFTLYTSCAPCIQCFGALYWAGVAHVVAGGRKELAEEAGFQEGPVSPELWARAEADKGLSYELAALPDEVAKRPFDVYRAVGGPLY